MKNVLKYPGSKTRIAKWITQFIPEHDIYLEPFFGGGAADKSFIVSILAGFLLKKTAPPPKNGSR